MIDVHVHLAALPDGTNGCYISPKMLRSPLFRFVARQQGLPLNDPAAANRIYLTRLREELAASEHVSRVVLLGMDGVYDAEGRLALAKTDFRIANEYVLATARSDPDRFLAGVSINPQRRDAVEELTRCVEAGAVLVKVLPNAQGFDPADRRYVPFYRALAERGIPLLSHVGYEFSLIGKDQSAGDPDRLRLPLEEGVTVIAAHACSLGLVFFEKYFPAFRRLVEEYQRFYADVSALTLPNRARMLYRLRRHPELHDRLLFGTDYPLSVFTYHAFGRIPFAAWRAIRRRKSRFDRQFLLLRALGIRFASFPVPPA